MLPLRMMGLLVLMVSPCDADGGCAVELTLDPPEVVKEYNESVLVNCTSTEEDHHGMWWRVGNTDTAVEHDNSFISWSVPQLDWNVTAECIMKLNETYECRENFEITVYKNPEVVTLFPTKHAAAVEGTLYELQCDVINVAPVQNLTVRWYRDNQTIRADHFSNLTRSPVSQSSTLRVNVSRADDAAQFRCEAQLDFGPHGSQPPVSSKIHTVSVHYAPELKAKTEDLHLFQGQLVNLTCDAEGFPPPAFHWTRDGVHLMENTSYLPVKHETSTTYECTAANNLGNATKQIHVRVIEVAGAPAAVTTFEPSTPSSCPLVLTPADIVVRFGGPASVNCSTSATKVLRIGWEATVGGTVSTNSTEITWAVEKVEDWNIDSICYITLEEYQCTKMPHLTIYKTPDSVSVSELDQGPMLDGREHGLECVITNVAPLHKLRVTWYRGNETWHTEMFNGTVKVPVNVSTVLRVTPDRDGNGALFRCEAKLLLGTKDQPELAPAVTSSPYTANVHYGPVLQGPHKEEVSVHPGDHVTFNCSAEGNPPPEVHWIYHNAANVAETARGRQKSVSIAGATSTDAGVYFCVATNEVGSATRAVTLIMTETRRHVRLTFMWVLLAVLVVALIFIIAIVAHRCTKHGQYTVVSDKATDGSDIPMTPLSDGV